MPTPLRDRLRAQLRVAMKARDDVAVTALRAALGAIDNAEAVAVPDTSGPKVGVIAGSVAGLGAADVARSELTEAAMAAIVQAEVDDRRAAADGYDQGGQAEAATRLRAEATVLHELLL